MEFSESKQKQLSKEDMSSIGKWDAKIKGLCEKLNKMDKYYTTSSCGGRIMLIKKLDKKSKDVFLFKSHKKVSFLELKKAIDKISKEYKDMVDFQQTTCILHVACVDLDSAQDLVNKAKFAGWKHSGIMATKKRIIVELHSTEKLEFPIMDKGKVLVDDDFLKIVVEQANIRLERVWEKVEKLSKSL
jgi:tRNA wybutosine-synthesizing protein 3